MWFNKKLIQNKRGLMTEIHNYLKVSKFLCLQKYQGVACKEYKYSLVIWHFSSDSGDYQDDETSYCELWALDLRFTILKRVPRVLFFLDIHHIKKQTNTHTWMSNTAIFNFSLFNQINRMPIFIKSSSLPNKLWSNNFMIAEYYI